MPLSTTIFLRSFCRQYLRRNRSYQIAALQFVLRSGTFATALLCACKPNEREQANHEVARAESHGTVTVAAITDSLPPLPARAVKPRYGDAITVTDTLINEPRIEARGSAWVLRLPRDMARTERQLAGINVA